MGKVHGAGEFNEPDRDSRGEWQPEVLPLMACPLFLRPFRGREMLKWAVGFVWPSNLLIALVATASWFWLTPDLAVMGTLNGHWMSLLLLRNLAIVLLIYGSYHLLLYTFKVQGTAKKFHASWQEKHSRFLFHSQVYDNMLRTLLGTVIWTVYEIVYFTLFARGYLPSLAFASHPVWFVTALFLIPLWREVHFYLVHRLLHWGPLMRKVHVVHHFNFNPGPWSGMAMHWIEHVLYFSVVLPHFFLPLHPLHFLYDIQHAGISPAAGHDGFGDPVAHGLIRSSSYQHYLHHRYVSCNYGGSGDIPLDRWFGSFYDGSIPFKDFRKKAQRFQTAGPTD